MTHFDTPLLSAPPSGLALPERSLGTLDYVHNVDALTLLRALGDMSVDAIVTDPPYGIDKAKWDRFFPVHWIQEAWRVTSRIIVLTGNPEFFEVAQKVGRCKSCVIMHNRNGMTRGNISFGNWIPALVCGEWDWEARPNHIGFVVSAGEEIEHPDPKPLDAMKKLLNYYTKPNWTILDPFAGSGTTLVAARNLGRHYIGCDISAEYVAIARKRLAMPYTMPFPQMLETA